MTSYNGNFRCHIGYAMVGFTLAYIAAVTTAWFAGCQMSEMVKEGVMFCFGWLFAKAGTVVDFIFGTSQSSEDKGKVIAASYPPGTGGCRYPGGEGADDQRNVTAGSYPIGRRATVRRPMENEHE